MDSRKIQDWLVSQLAEQLELPPSEINIHEPFSNYGLSSRDLVTLSGDLEEWLGRRLSPSLAYEYPSILLLSNHLADDRDVDGLSKNTESFGESKEPIAIIGMSCRFPGANDLESFWKLILNGVDAISEIPEDRWPKQAYFNPDPLAPGKSISKWGGFLEHVDQFDPFFFGISPNEAKQMDPQQRLLLELSYEALDHAGQNIEQLEGSRTGVFIGISVNEYSQFQLENLAGISGLSGTGSALSVAANRISYFFNLKGPSMAIDTACSSSLTALHLACQSLRNGETSMALAGGVNVILSPAHSIAFTKAGVLASDGRCKTFDANADGYVRGEGGGVVVLKKLSDALEEGDQILALIAGSAVAQDGRTNGLMAPNRESQEALLREAYRVAGVSPNRVQYVEAHGTGTLLGDSMEAAAIGTVIGLQQKDSKCSIGSVKTNIGHLEAAAGIAGLIKVVLSMQHRIIPPSLHFHQPNPHIPFESLNLQVQTEAKPWPVIPGQSIAGISSFGFGGTNVHVVLQDWGQEIHEGEKLNESKEPIAHLIPISANSQEGLELLASEIKELVDSERMFSLRDLCSATGRRRSGNAFRMAVLAKTRVELSNSLEAFVKGHQDPSVLTGGKAPNRQPNLVFVFSGQGGQWPGMGKELLNTQPVFSQTIDEIGEIIQQDFGWSLRDLLLASPSEHPLDQIERVQPAIFAIQVALAKLWKDWGVSPDAVIGHSMGEVAAAHFSGILSLKDAIRIICIRSERLKKLKGQGAMLATDLSLDQALDYVRSHENSISIAAFNSPTSTVLSGNPKILESIKNSLEIQNRFCRWVKVDVASHSPQLEPLRAELIEALTGLEPQTSRIPFYSTVTGTLGDNLTFDANYWVDNMRKPVLFSKAVAHLLDQDYTRFIEIGPHPILLSSIQQTWKPHHSELRLLPSMRREESEREVILGTLGILYVEGNSVKWDKIYPGPSKNVSLPSIRWNKQRYWIDFIGSNSKKQIYWYSKESITVHPLLGERIDLAHLSSIQVWQNQFSSENLGFLSDHRIEEEIVFPAAGFIEMALQIAEESGILHSHNLTEFQFLQKMVLREEGATSVQAILSKEKENGFALKLYARSDGKGDWIPCATASYTPKTESEEFPTFSKVIQEIFNKDGVREFSKAQFYETLSLIGLSYGESFKGVEQIWRNGNEVLSRINLPSSLQYEIAAFHIHPSLLDSCLQVLAGFVFESSDTPLFIPSACKELRFFTKPDGPLWSHAKLRSGSSLGPLGLEADLSVFDESGNLVLELFGLELRQVARMKSWKPTRKDTWFYQLSWEKKSELDLSTPLKGKKRNWLIFADSEGLGELLAQELQARGDSCFLWHWENEIDLGEEEILRKIEGILSEIPSSLDGVVHLWSLSIPMQFSDSHGKADLLGCNSVLFLLKALANRFSGSPKLFLVTKGVHAVFPHEPISVEQSPIWGLGKVISFELPELKCTRIDLDYFYSSFDSLPELVRQISQDDPEDQIAFRSGERYVLRLKPFWPEAKIGLSGTAFRSDKTYLITGGLGGLGLVIAKWMVKKGARRLVLVGRSEPSPATLKILDTMHESGAEVIVAQADVSDFAQMESLFDKMGEHLPPLAGVIHAAGLLDDGALVNLTAERMKSVMAPKVRGTWNLHQLTASTSLDFFVLFSSAVSVLGSPGQGNYAAGSAYLDAMANYRRQLKLPAISINWGPWAEVGLAAEVTEKLQEQNSSTQHLVKVIEIDQGLEILEFLLKEDVAQVAVVPFDLENLLALYPTAASMPFFEDVGGKQTHVARLYARPNLRQEYVAPRTEVESKLADLWQQTLHIDKVGVRDSFFELGGDSVLAAQILAMVRKTYGISISPQDAFQAFTIERLSDLLESEMIRQIEEMSEEEAKKRLS
ncbi:type I polyketide synthase [Algoriphagus sp. AK58]|uniref:type I polyketide synthase n=1 Tax=Algoriphagus sp. AK58 TaxID=1406877 RepID=UPI00164FFB38|nr:type I polyketide synthase [Algoriphagus sp. AK58]MBC6366466.1 hypothetical protein [Algoriphagus sp. AK58]